MSAPSLDARRFVAVDNDGGEVGADTVFEYRERDGEIWATYTGGAIRRGYLVGTRVADQISLRYVQLNVDGETATGRCSTVVNVLPDGRVRLDETWQWESPPGAGTSVVEELPG